MGYNNCGKTFMMNNKGGGSEGECTPGIVHLATMDVFDNVETDQESTSKNIMSDERKNMSPVMFETFLFLHKNNHLWDMEDVAKAIQTKPSDEIIQRNLDEFYN